MARGNWRNWDETTCDGCGARMYVKNSKKYKEKRLCISCYEKAKAGEPKAKGKGWKEAPDASGKAPRHREAAIKNDLSTVLRTPMEREEIKETIEDAKVIAKGIVSELGVEVVDAELIGSFGAKGFSAKDIDVLVHIKNDIGKLEGTKIISTKVDGKLLDIFVRDEKERQGVFQDRGFESHFIRISRGS